MDAAMIAAKSLPDVSKIDRFDGTCFKRWQQKVHSTLDVHNLAQILTEKQPVLGSEGYDEKFRIWEKVTKYVDTQFLAPSLMNCLTYIAIIKMPKKFGIYYTKNILLKMLKIKNMP